MLPPHPQMEVSETELLMVHGGSILKGVWIILVILFTFSSHSL